MMRDHGEMLKLLVLHGVCLDEVAHIDHVGFDDLIERRSRIRPQHRRDHLLVDRREHVRNKTEAAKFEVDVPENRLTLVQRHE